MIWRVKPGETLPEKVEMNPQSEFKYQRPKIFLVDLGDRVEEVLLSEGYRVTSGSFGRPYRVEMDSKYTPVIANYRLPNYTEQEVVVINLFAGEPADGPEGEKMVPMGERDIWANSKDGVVDPRPRIMAISQSLSDRIFNSGGVFIVFSDHRIKQDLVTATATEYDLFSERQLDIDNWSFLSILSNLKVVTDHGEEIFCELQNSPLQQLLSDHLKESTFHCSFESHWSFEDRWLVLARNKYGNPVAAMIAPVDKEQGGCVFLFPRIRNMGDFMSGLLKNVLPDLVPTLFPHAEGQRWIYRDEYELPSVLEKRRMKSSMQEDVARKVQELDEAIEIDRSRNKFLYDLIRETGEPLVAAVITALNVLGFKNVVNVDEEKCKSGSDSSLGEDLQVHDISPTLVVEVKGVAGTPSDSEALQAQKHVLVFMQEHNRVDAKGLTIINHQRMLPPLERNNITPYRKEILTNAQQTRLGLMTGWDLFRLVRGKMQHNWKTEHVKPVLYGTGRIDPIPNHYQLIGRVSQVWKPAFSIKIEIGEIRIGDRVAIEFPVDFHEQSVTSLHVDDKAVGIAAAQTEVGILRDEDAPRVKPGMRVFRISA